jgi:hypothetical protein
VTGLSDAERDATDVAQALAGLVARLRRPAGDGPGPDQRGQDPYDPAADEVRRMLLDLAEDGEIAAARVLGYLRGQRGSGDGEMAAVPPRLGQWRDWVPPRGHLFVAPGDLREPNEVHQHRRSDPGE